MGNVLDQEITDRYAVYNGDCIEVMPGCRTGRCTCRCTRRRSRQACTTTQSSERDLSNSRSYDEFMSITGTSSRELHRLTMPGRITAVHCMDVPTGNSGVRRADRLPRRHHPPARQVTGSHYAGRHSIWKEPLAVRNRTMVKDLTHKTIVDDSPRSRPSPPPTTC